MTLLTLADDLTGAADSGARCRKAGLPATIFLGEPLLPLPTGAVAITSDSRTLAPTAAAHRVYQMAAPLAQLPGVVWYKKIDSTLRGNLGSELDALLTVLAAAQIASCAVICPAFPAYERGLLDGRLVFDQLSQQTIHLPLLLAEQTNRPVVALPLADVRGGETHLARQLLAARGKGAELFVVDGLTDPDLRTLLEAANRALPDALFCGSAGLVSIMAQQMAAAAGMGSASRWVLPSRTGATVVVVGSGSSMAHRQIEAVRRRQGRALLEVHPSQHLHLQNQYNAVRALMYTPLMHWLLHLPRPNTSTALEGPEARSLVDYLAKMAVNVIGDMQPSLLILVGGDTAIQVLKRLGIRRLKVLQEVLPGIPLTEGSDQNGREFHIVLKAGNHGDENTLVQLLRLGLRQ